MFWQSADLLKNYPTGYNLINKLTFSRSLLCLCFSLINFDVHTQFSRVYLISIIPFNNFILLLQVNFLLCQFLALFLASIFRSYLHPSKVSFEVRHTFALSLGLAFGYFCFGQQAIHIAGLPAICYIVIRTQDPRIVQRWVNYCINIKRKKQFKDLRI